MDSLMDDGTLPLHVIQSVVHPNINTIRPGRNPVRHTHFIHEQTNNPQNQERRVAHRLKQPQ
jgi:hypothetical protein